MDKITMTTPLVEMDGDEMTRILWKMIKEELLLPYIDLKTEYYDWASNIVTRQMIKSPWILRRRLRNTVWQSNALPSPLMLPE